MDKAFFESVPDLIDRAILFATYAHRNAVRKGSSSPYIFHPLEAGNIAAGITRDKEVIAAAILHDVAEDTSFTLQDIQNLFGSRITSLVESDTENKRSDRPAHNTWKIRKQETIEGLDSASSDEKLIVFADRLSDLRSLCNPAGYPHRFRS